MKIQVAVFWTVTPKCFKNVGILPHHYSVTSQKTMSHM